MSNPMMKVRGLAKRFSPQSTPDHLPVVAVDGLDLTVPRGAMFTILGPSGCGKTTTLRCIAGLERPDAGEISVDGRVVVSDGRFVPPNERGLGMVFQSYAIWPHMSVFDNAAFPLTVVPRRRRLSAAEIRAKVSQVLEMVQLTDLHQREATALSGGQQQRLALARALVLEPSVLLLDEPLSNLDAKLREDMRFELQELQRKLDITTVYVTHDQVEALSISSQVAVMNAGRLEQVGTPHEIYQSPASRFVAGFIGASNFIDGVVESVANGEYLIKTAAGPVRVESTERFDPADIATVAVRPEEIEFVRPATGEDDWVGEVLAQAFLGDAVDHVVDVAGYEMKVRTHSRGAQPTGTRVGLHFPQGACSLLPSE